MVNVYLPYNCHNNLDAISYYLSNIDNIVCNHSSPYCFIIGDFNADVKNVHNGKIIHIFGVYSYNFRKNERLIIADTLTCSSNTFTNYSSTNGITSWFDHIVITINGESVISDIFVEYKFVTSDHLPITVCFELDDIVTSTNDDSNKLGDVRTEICVNWHGVDNVQKSKYKYDIDYLLQSVDIDHGLVLYLKI